MAIQKTALDVAGSGEFSPSCFPKTWAEPNKLLKWRWPTWVKITLCLAILTAVTLSAFWGLPASIQYRVTENYLLSAPEGASIYLGLLLPKSNASQMIKNVRVSWPGTARKEQVGQVDVLRLIANGINDSLVEATVQYDVILDQSKTSWEGEVQDVYLQPQPGIESDDPAILKRASLITNGTSRDDAYAILQFTSEHINWSAGGLECSDTSALHAYEDGVGSCSGFANLMVALCRASGIPARRMSGIILPDLAPFWSSSAQPWEHPGEAHGWVEIHTEYGWESADPSCSSGLLRRFQFGRHDGRYLSFGECESEGRSYAEMYRWATGKGQLIGSEFAALKFVTTADSDDVTVTPKVGVKKRWDGRIFNTLIVWVAAVSILIFLSRRWVNR